MSGEDIDDEENVDNGDTKGKSIERKVIDLEHVTSGSAAPPGRRSAVPPVHQSLLAQVVAGGSTPANAIMVDVEAEAERTAHSRPPTTTQFQAIPLVTHTDYLMALSNVQIARTEFMVKLSSSAITRQLQFTSSLNSTTFRQAVLDVWGLNVQSQDILYVAATLDDDTYHPFELREGSETDYQLLLHRVGRWVGWRQPHLDILVVYVEIGLRR